MDSTIKFDHKELNLLAKESKSKVDVDSIPLENLGKKSFKKASDTYYMDNLYDLFLIGNEMLHKDPSFSGFIMFSKPVVQSNSPNTIEIFIKVTKIITPPRHCFVLILINDNKIIDAEELQYIENLIFR